MTVAILGGAGYIGSHCARYLHQQGYAVAIYDQVAHPALSDLPAAQGDISDRSRLRDFCLAHDVQAVIHCAGKIDVAESVRHPALYHRYNVTYTADVLAVLRELKIRHVIFSSSCSVYGDPQFLPLTEAHPIGPVSPYGESKVAAEALLHKAAETDQLRYVSLRFFNAAGADPDGILGENHDPETHLIPRLLRHLAEGEPFGFLVRIIPPQTVPVFAIIFMSGIWPMPIFVPCAICRPEGPRRPLIWEAGGAILLKK